MEATALPTTVNTDLDIEAEVTNAILALDALRALGADDRAFKALKAEVTRCLAAVRDDRLAESGWKRRRPSGRREQNDCQDRDRVSHGCDQLY